MSRGSPLGRAGRQPQALKGYNIGRAERDP